MPNALDGLKKTDDLSYVRRHTVTSTNANLSIEDFYKLMSAQLKYQDPSNPTDSTDMLNQMTQMAMISSIENMNIMTQTTYAASMMGKEVTVAKVAEGSNKLIGEEKGVVTGVNLSGKNMTIWVNGKEYPLSRVMQIGKTGNEKKADKEKPEAGVSGSLGKVANTENHTSDTSGNSETGIRVNGSESTDTTYMGHSPAVNTDKPSEAIPPMTVISDKPVDTVPAYDMKDNEDKIIVPVG